MIGVALGAASLRVRIERKVEFQDRFDSHDNGLIVPRAKPKKQTNIWLLKRTTLCAARVHVFGVRRLFSAERALNQLLYRAYQGAQDGDDGQPHDDDRVRWVLGGISVAKYI